MTRDKSCHGRAERHFGAPPPLARTSLARFAADGSAVTFGLLAGIVTARLLGPAGKGTLAALLLLVNVFGHTCSLGLGDASVIAYGQRKADLRAALSATVLPVIAAATAGALSVFLISTASFEARLPASTAAAAAVAVPVIAFMHLLSMVLNARERLALTSGALGMSFAINAVTVWVLIAVFDLGVLGGVLGSLVGPAVAVMVMGPALRTEGLSLVPRWSPTFLRGQLRAGLLIQGAYLLIAMTQRIDQLLVLWLAGSSEAGHYSVALTVGQLVVYAPMAIATAAFPRFAYLEPAESALVMRTVVRTSVALVLLVVVGLLIGVPFLVPLLFGSEFRAAVAPSLILLLGGGCLSIQWVLCRALAARGRPRPLAQSFALSLVTMVVLDLLLIPAAGGVGAAVASAVGAGCGLAYVLWLYRRADDLRIRSLDMLPRRKDFIRLWSAPLAILRGEIDALRR